VKVESKVRGEPMPANYIITGDRPFDNNFRLSLSTSD